MAGPTDPKRPEDPETADEPRQAADPKKARDEEEFEDLDVDDAEITERVRGGRRAISIPP